MPVTYQNPGVFGGIMMGLLTAVVWQRYHRTKLVDWLGFFNGRRLVPIIMAFVCCVLGVAVRPGLWEPVGDALTSFAKQLIDLGSWGAGIFGVANRALLVPIGMHQFLNTFVWFQFGAVHQAGRHGGARRPRPLPGGDPTAGQFTVGLLPDHDVRAAGGGAGDHPLRQARAAARRSAA